MIVCLSRRAKRLFVLIVAASIPSFSGSVLPATAQPPADTPNTAVPPRHAGQTVAIAANSTVDPITRPVHPPSERVAELHRAPGHALGPAPFDRFCGGRRLLPVALQAAPSALLTDHCANGRTR